MKKQHTFPQRIGKLIEQHVIKTEELMPNKRQQTIGYFDAYNSKGIYEIKAAKDDNYFRINQLNHKTLCGASGIYIFVRYTLIDNDKVLKMITDINIKDTQHIPSTSLQSQAKLWSEDKRNTVPYYKVKI